MLLHSQEADGEAFVWQKRPDSRNSSRESPRNLSRTRREWLSQLAIAGEPECMSILYAKSLLDPEQCRANATQRVVVAMRYPSTSSPSLSPVNSETAPTKPQRCIARMTSTNRSNIMTASTRSDDYVELPRNLPPEYSRKYRQQRRPVSSLMSGEVVLRAHAAANRYAYDRRQSTNKDGDVAVWRTSNPNNSLTLPSQRPPFPNQHRSPPVHMKCTVTTSYPGESDNSTRSSQQPYRANSSPYVAQYDARNSASTSQFRDVMSRNGVDIRPPPPPSPARSSTYSTWSSANSQSRRDSSVFELPCRVNSSAFVSPSQPRSSTLLEALKCPQCAVLSARCTCSDTGAYGNNRVGYGYFTASHGNFTASHGDLPTTHGSEGEGSPRWSNNQRMASSYHAVSAYDVEKPSRGYLAASQGFPACSHGFSSCNLGISPVSHGFSSQLVPSPHPQQPICTCHWAMTSSSQNVTSSSQNVTSSPPPHRSMLNIAISSDSDMDKTQRMSSASDLPGRSSERSQYFDVFGRETDSDSSKSEHRRRELDDKDNRETHSVKDRDPEHLPQGVGLGLADPASGQNATESGNNATNLEDISEASSRTLSTDTLCCSECGDQEKNSEVNDDPTSSTEHYDTAVTIRVPSPNTVSTTCTNTETSEDKQLLSPARSTDDMLSQKRGPPSYAQLRVIHKGDRTTSQVMLNEFDKPTIGVKQQSEASISNPNTTTAPFVNIPRSRCPLANSNPSTSGVQTGGACAASPDSMDSGSNSSVDSGQGSGEASQVSHKEVSDRATTTSSSSSSYGRYARSNLPSYARIASSMDHVLRTSSVLNSQLNSVNTNGICKEMLTKANVFIQIVDASPCARFLPAQDILAVKQLASEIQAERNASNRSQAAHKYFAFVLKKLMHEMLVILARIISRYLSDCVNKDRLLVIALEHLIHLTLFGDPICLEVIKSGGLDAILSFIGMPTTPNDTLRLLLRATAILCGLSIAAVKLISLGGLETVIHILCTCNVACAVEAAGVITQLTNPKYALVKLNSSFAHIIARLLDVIDECETAESLLLCTAALSSCSAQQQSLINNLYEHNATARLISALKRPACDTIFVREQMAGIFSRLASEGYEEALIAQGALPIVLSMLSFNDPAHADYCRRVRYKATMCLDTIAAKGVGLKAIYESNGYAILTKALQKEELCPNPTAMICLRIKKKLERKYHMESAV